MIKKSVLLTALAIAGFAVTSLAQTVPNYVPSNGLVGWWPFNGNATDESINTNDGTVNGATLTADRFGNANSAYSFNGNNGVNIIVQDAINLRPQNFTLNAFQEQQCGIKLCQKELQAIILILMQLLNTAVQYLDKILLRCIIWLLLQMELNRRQ
jgi:hypothetical protein